MICGLPGSGKSTLALQLEQELPALRLTTDEWMQYLIGMGYDDEYRDGIEKCHWIIASRALRLGVNVILEPGFWLKRERLELSERATALGATVKLYFLDVPLRTLQERMQHRNATNEACTFKVSQEQLMEWWKVFERPDEHESPIIIKHC